MTLVGRLRQWFGNGATRRPACRLTESEACDIARQAIGRATPLVVQDVVETAAGVEWRIATATVGSGTTVRIADATGEVLAKNSWGVR